MWSPSLSLAFTKLSANADLRRRGTCLLESHIPILGRVRQASHCKIFMRGKGEGRPSGMILIHTSVPGDCKWRSQSARYACRISRNESWMCAVLLLEVTVSKRGSQVLYLLRRRSV